MAIPGLYLITDRKAASGPLLDVLEDALLGGVRLVQLREKDLSARELLSLSIEMAALAHKCGARLLINDRADIALLSGADGVHLTSKSYSPKEARRLLGDKALIGVSTHCIEEALKAEAEGADFVTFGPVFHTPSKAGMGEPLGLTKLREAVQRLSIPVFGLGGINEKNMADVAATGASVAMISAIMASTQPRWAAERILETLGTAETRRENDTA